MPYKKKWKDLTFEEKVVRHENTGTKRKQFQNADAEYRREQRINLAEHLEETGWVSVYDALTILALEDTRDNHVWLAQLATRHKLKKQRVGIINFYKKTEILNERK
tara:strand:+ start:462 stop:779 length:318 start_codon:yes stop_codon:yes gene_type:complete